MRRKQLPDAAADPGLASVASMGEHSTEAVHGTSARGLVTGISVEQEHEPAGTVEQIELILLAAIDVERL